MLPTNVRSFPAVPPSGSAGAPLFLGGAEPGRLEAGDASRGVNAASAVDRRRTSSLPPSGLRHPLRASGVRRPRKLPVAG